MAPQGSTVLPPAVLLLDQAPNGVTALGKYGISPSTSAFAFSKRCSGKLGQFVVLLSIMREWCITRPWGPAVTWESAELRPPQHPHRPTCVGLQVLLGQLSGGKCCLKRAFLPRSLPG